jgi:hypothetical protein
VDSCLEVTDDALNSVFYTFCVYGKRSGPPDLLDGRQFAKMMKDAKIMNKKFNTTAMDILFSKVLIDVLVRCGSGLVGFTEVRHGMGIVRETHTRCCCLYKNVYTNAIHLHNVAPLSPQVAKKSKTITLYEWLHALGREVETTFLYRSKSNRMMTPFLVLYEINRTCGGGSWPGYWLGQEKARY